MIVYAYNTNNALRYAVVGKLRTDVIFVLDYYFLINVFSSKFIYRIYSTG